MFGIVYPVQARFAVPSLVPIDKTLKKTETYLQQFPKDARGWYVLARLHYLAFFNSSLEVPLYNSKRILPAVVPFWYSRKEFDLRLVRSEAIVQILEENAYSSVSGVPDKSAREFWLKVSKRAKALSDSSWKPVSLDKAQRVEHAIKSKAAFDKAMRHDSSNGLYPLGLAGLLEQVKSLKAEGDQAVFQSIDDTQISAIYYRAFTLEKLKALSIDRRPIEPLRSIVAYEAGQSFLRLMKNDPSSDTPSISLKISEVTQVVDQLHALPRRRMVTPVLFSFDADLELWQLLDFNRIVEFDLDGDGIKELRPWVKAGTAFLVWDPGYLGIINSGRQLFGSYTFQIPHDNGYQALSLLDLNNNGNLEDGELDGIRIWIELDPDGKADRSEVFNLNDLDIHSIRSDYECDPAGTPYSKEGILLKNGHTLRTWDYSFPTVESSSN